MYDGKHPAKDIFERRFLVRVPMLASMDDLDIEIYGVPHLNDPEYDNYYQHAEVTRRATINEMVEIMRKGCNIKIINRADTKLIFEIITTHLANMRRLAASSLNAKIPHQDLLDLDRLASSIYPYARKRITTDLAESNFMRSLTTGSLINISQTSHNTKDTTYEDYQSNTEWLEEDRIRVTRMPYSDFRD